MIKRIFFLLSALSIVLLTACGEQDAPPDRLVYVPQEIDCDADGFTHISQLCADDEYLYFIGAFITGGTEGQSEYAPVRNLDDSLYRVPLTGGKAEALENYSKPVLPKDSEADVFLSQFQLLEDGTFWVKEGITFYKFSCPPGFHPETGDKWRYWTGTRSANVWRHLDSTGKELEWLDTAELEKILKTPYIYSVLPDTEGNLYVETNNSVAVLDQEHHKLFELDFGEIYGELCQGADGTMAVAFTCLDDDNEQYGYQLWLIDTENQCWGETYELGIDTQGIFPGNAEYPFLYLNGSSVYGWKDGESQRLFNCFSVEPHMDNVLCAALAPDGRVVATGGYSYNTEDLDLLLFTPTDPAELPEKTVLTLAVMGRWEGPWSMIQKFNQSHDGCQIEVLDYNEYNTGSNPEAGVDRLNEDIRAGNIPDLFFVSGHLPRMPLNLYGSQGILEDLWPFIDADTGLGGRQGLAEHVLDAASMDGRLYQAFGSFDIRTAIGITPITGGRTTWTVHDLQEALDDMSEGAALFYGTESAREWFFRQTLTVTMDQFLDWGTGECSFDSDAFKELLTFCGKLPPEKELPDSSELWPYEDEFSRLENRKQLLMMGEYLADFNYARYCREGLSRGYSFIGFPRADGKPGSCFVPGEVMAMSSTCKDKDAAWEFIRQVFLPKGKAGEIAQYGPYYFQYFPDFQVNKADFDLMLEYARMESDPDDVMPVMELYESIGSVFDYDEQLLQLIGEAAELFFDGERDLDATAEEIQKRVQAYMQS